MPNPAPNSNSCDVNNCWKIREDGTNAEQALTQEGKELEGRTTVETMNNKLPEEIQTVVNEPNPMADIAIMPGGVTNTEQVQNNAIDRNQVTSDQMANMNNNPVPMNNNMMNNQNNMNQPINNNVQNEMLDVPNNMNGGVNNVNDFSNPMADFNPASVNTASPATAALMNNVNDIGSNSFDGGFGNGNMNNFTNNEMSQMVAPQEDTVKNKNKDKNDTSGTIKPSFIPPINE
jgi:TolA-binding protein